MRREKEEEKTLEIDSSSPADDNKPGQRKAGHLHMELVWEYVVLFEYVTVRLMKKKCLALCTAKVNTPFCSHIFYPSASLFVFFDRSNAQLARRGCTLKTSERQGKRSVRSIEYT